MTIFQIFENLFVIFILAVFIFFIFVIIGTKFQSPIQSPSKHEQSISHIVN